MYSWFLNERFVYVYSWFYINNKAFREEHITIQVMVSINQ